MKATKDGYTTFMENKPGDTPMSDQSGAPTSAIRTLKQALKNGE